MLLIHGAVTIGAAQVGSVWQFSKGKQFEVFGGVSEVMFIGPPKTYLGLNQSNTVFQVSRHRGNPGFHFGVGLSSRTSKHFEMYSRLSFERLGELHQIDSVNLDSQSYALISSIRLVNERIANDYLTISFLPRVIIGNKFELSISAGPYFALLMNAKTHTEYYHLPAVFTRTAWLYHSYDYGLRGQVRASVKVISRWIIFVQAEFSRGLTGIRAPVFGFPQPTWYNEAHSITIGIRKP